ncbi:MAG TPA: hypothetical protein VGC42_25485 [Kofleriaceae bacterium]
MSALAGCGLISSDVTDFSIKLPDKKFSIDATAWQVDQDKASALFKMSCAASTMVCNSAAQAICTGASCTGTCSASTQTCELSLQVSVSQPVDLLMEAPDLKSVSDQSVVKVAVDTVTYEVTTNSLNIDTPDLAVYVAPMSVTKADPSNTQIKQIGTIPGIAAGQKTSAPRPIQFTATGKSELQDIMGSFKTPFNVLVGSALTVDQHTMVPTGRLDAVVHVVGHAGL